MPNEFYSEEEAEQILRLAANQSSRGGLSRDEIMRMASELGIPPESVHAAETQVLRHRAEQDIAKAESGERELYKREKRNEFLQHFSMYLVINTFLVMIFLFTGSHSYFWPKWPMLGWGIGIASHFFATLGEMTSEDAFQKWQLKRRKRQAKMLGDGAKNLSVILDEYVMAGGGSKLEAITRLRAATGLELMAAKAAVDEYALQNPGVIS